MDPLPRDNRLALHSTQRLLDQARTSKFSTIPHLSEEAVANIWFGVSQFIAKAITDGKGVNVTGLGTFALSVVDDRTPIFQLSEQFVHKHGLKASTKPTSSSSPIVSLNFAEISRATDHRREDVESCFREIMAALDAQVREPSPRGLSLIFFGVGKLSIRAGKVRFAFFTKFLENPHTVDSANAFTELSSRPATVGIVEHLESISRSAQGDRLATPRLLCTPTVTHLNIDLNGPTQNTWMPTSALDPDLRPQRVHRSKVMWQSALNSDTMVPILDGPSSNSGHAPVTPPPDPARRVRPKPVDRIDEDVEDEEVEQYEKLAQRNMQSSLFVPLDAQAKTQELTAIKAGPVSKQDMRLPKVHRKDRVNPDKVDPKGLPSYEEWAKLREQRGKSPARHRLRIRDQLDRDETIQKSKEHEEKEQELLLHSLEKKKVDKAAALERKREQARREAERQAALFNASISNSKKNKKNSTEEDDDTPGGADVFVFRPPTSKTEIRKQNQELLSDLVAQSTDRKTKEQQAFQRKKEEEKRELHELTQSLTEAQLKETQRRQQEMQRYKADLDQQITFKTTTEGEATRMHPRQRLPFDLKHLPGNDNKELRANSALGRRAAALGPEMYRQHDEFEKRLKNNARRVYDEQLQFDATRRRQMKEAQDKEREEDSRMVNKTLQEYKQDMANERTMRKQMRQDLQTTWQGQHTDKRERESQEMSERRKAADAPIKDQMDYHAFINGFA